MAQLNFKNLLRIVLESLPQFGNSIVPVSLLIMGFHASIIVYERGEQILALLEESIFKTFAESVEGLYRESYFGFLLFGKTFVLNMFVQIFLG